MFAIFERSDNNHSMLDELLHFFTGYGPLEIDKTGKPSDEALKVATASLLWETCLADNELEEFEVNKLTEIMRTAFNISEKEVEVISAMCAAENSKEKIDEFVGLLKEHFDDVQREKIVQMAAEISNADHDLEMPEGLVCDLLRKRLALPG